MKDENRYLYPGNMESGIAVIAQEKCWSIRNSIKLTDEKLAGDGSSISIAVAADGYLPKCSGPYTFKELGTPEVTLESNKNITEMKYLRMM